MYKIQISLIEGFSRPETTKAIKILGKFEKQGDILREMTRAYPKEYLVFSINDNELIMTVTRDNGKEFFQLKIKKDETF